MSIIDKYDLFCQSIQGANHIKKGLVCEDFGLKYENEKNKIFVLGDGHGDPACTRSQIGSKLLCEIAAKELENFAITIESTECIEQVLDETKHRPIIEQLVRAIFGKWSCAVREEYEENPLSEQEREVVGKRLEDYECGENIEHLYGTTFIAGLLTEEYLLLLQQGDGRCVVFDEFGNATQPIPWDDRCYANMTTSVCDFDAVQSCRWYIIDLCKENIMACFASTDGVEDSFGSMDEMHAYYCDQILYACDNGVRALEEEWLSSLPELSQTGSRNSVGSGDDITICGFVDVELANAKYTALEEFNYKVKRILDIKFDMAYAKERIISMTSRVSKMEYLKQKYQQLEETYDERLSQLKQVEENLADARKDLEHMESQPMHFSGVTRLFLNKGIQTLEEEKKICEENLQKALEEKSKCKEEYFPLLEKYEGYVALVEEKEKELLALEMHETEEEE